MDPTIVRDGQATRALRRAMVDNQIRTFDVTDQLLLERFYTVPREAFLSPDVAELAYSDAALTVGFAGSKRRSLLVPMVLARLLQGAAVRATDKVLVVGNGLGYAAAILGGLASQVVALECDEAFTSAAAQQFRSLSLSNVTAVTGPLEKGHAANAPYDLIVIAGAVEANLDTLLAQLGPRGRLVTIRKTSFDGVRRNGKATLFERFGQDISSRSLFDSSSPVLEDFRETAGFAF